MGDSRIYRVRDQRLTLLTRDDSLLRDQVDLGVISAAEARHSHNRSLVTRALGIEAEVSPHLADERALPGDVYVLCSDGLNDLVEDADIELIVTARGANLPLAAQHLVADGQGQRRLRQRVGDPRQGACAVLRAAASACGSASRYVDRPAPAGEADMAKLVLSSGGALVTQRFLDEEPVTIGRDAAQRPRGRRSRSWPTRTRRITVVGHDYILESRYDGRAYR